MKPFLKKIVPASVLRRGKQTVLDRVRKEIVQIKKEPFRVGAYPEGINLIGPIDSATGLGQSFRLLEAVVEQTSLPYLIYNYEQNTKNRIAIEEYRDKIKDRLEYGINLWHVNPSDFAECYAFMGRDAFDRRYNIAYWLWELEEFPDEWTDYFNILDEIWTPSEFISRGIRKKTEKPVVTVPYHITAKSDIRRYGRNYFGLPEGKFLFLMMYDVQSITERKNPEGVIRAFRSAFPPEEEGVGLVIKVNSADTEELDMIRRQLKGYSNVYLIHENLEKIQVNSLIACMDVFVSLHRAEGFGLVLAEAMLNYVPTIATNWSANTEFMNEEVACMVDYTLKRLERDIPPYKKGNQWAEPDIAQAANYMQRLYADRAYYREKSAKAYQYITSKLSMERIRSMFEERTGDITNGRK